METKKRKHETLTDPVSSRRRRRRLRTPSREDTPGTPPPPATRDWAALPDDNLLAIFSRLGHIDILLGAELTCASWRRIAVNEPTLWRRIDMPNTRADVENLSLGAWVAMARAAVDRSAGQCKTYCGPVDFDFLSYLAASSPSLRSLHMTSFYLPSKDSADRVIPNLPMLERLVLSHDARWFYLCGPMGSKLRMRLEKMVKLKDLNMSLVKRQLVVD